MQHRQCDVRPRRRRPESLAPRWGRQHVKPEFPQHPRHVGRPVGRDLPHNRVRAATSCQCRLPQNLDHPRRPLKWLAHLQSRNCLGGRVLQPGIPGIERPQQGGGLAAQRGQPRDLAQVSQQPGRGGGGQQALVLQRLVEHGIQDRRSPGPRLPQHRLRVGWVERQPVRPVDRQSQAVEGVQLLSGEVPRGQLQRP